MEFFKNIYALTASKKVVLKQECVNVIEISKLIGQKRKSSGVSKNICKLLHSNAKFCNFSSTMRLNIILKSLIQIRNPIFMFFSWRRLLEEDGI